MTWITCSMLIMAAVVATGTLWYERSLPSTRTVALVASLAGLAALGRIAFAPIPGVKPTTDIVLLTGYALGSAPGFMVGVTAALAANFFFGQGPWTLWQMFAWGSIGILGAGIARLSANFGRWRLAGACAIAGVIFGVIVNFSFWVTFSGDHSLATLIAYSTTALPFDLTHIIGNVIFCLAFGPTLVHALRRYRRRSAVKWRAAPVAESDVG